MRIVAVLLLGCVVAAAAAASLTPGRTLAVPLAPNATVALPLAVDAGNGAAALVVSVFTAAPDATVALRVVADGADADVGQALDTFAAPGAQSVVVVAPGNSSYTLQLGLDAAAVADVDVYASILLVCNGSAVLGRSDDDTAVVCDVCPPNTVVADIADGCLCALGFYSTSGRAPCTACGVGINCTSTVGTRTGDITPLPGYYRYTPWADPALVLFVQCPLDDSCVGGAASACAEGFDGVLCASCGPGYYQLGYTCKPCMAGTATAFGLAWFLFVVMCGLCFVLAHWFANYSVLALLVDYVQGVLVIAFFQRNATALVKEAFWGLSIINFNWQLAQPECAEQPLNWVYRAVPYMMPLVAVGVYALVAGAAAAYASLRKRDVRDTVVHAALRCVGAYVTLMDLMYICLVITAVTLLQCQTAPDDPSRSSYWAANPSVACTADDRRFAALRGVGVAGVIVYVVGFPAVVTGLLVYYRGVLEESDVLRAALGPIYGRYQTDDYFWWPAVVYVRRALLVAIVSQLAEYNIVTSGVVVLFLFLLEFMATLTLHPQKRALANLAQWWFHAMLYILVFLMLFFFRSSFAAAVQSGVVLGVFVFTVVVGAVLWTQEILWVHDTRFGLSTSEPEEYVYTRFWGTDGVSLEKRAAELTALSDSSAGGASPTNE